MQVNEYCLSKRSCIASRCPPISGSVRDALLCIDVCAQSECIEESKPVDDKQAEAVLRALREPLIWKTYPARNCPEKSRWEIAELKDGNIVYTASPFYQRLRVTSFRAAVTKQEDAQGQGLLFPEKQRSPCRYKTRAAAKAACEHHWVTGHWQ